MAEREFIGEINLVVANSKMALLHDKCEVYATKPTICTFQIIFF